MPRESLESRRVRAEQIIDRLTAAYPDAHCELIYSSAFELLIATILSAQTTDKQVNIVTAKLFVKYRTARDFAEARVQDLEQDLKSLGFFRTKARNVQACCKVLVEKHGGEVPRTLDELTQLGGVGRKTANVVLGNAFSLNEGIVVDTHVARLSQRLNLTRQTDPVKIEVDLQKLVPRPQWTLFSHWLIWHGRRRCSAQRPDCAHCEVNDLCFSAKVPRNVAIN